MNAEIVLVVFLIFLGSCKIFNLASTLAQMTDGAHEDTNG